MIKKSIDGGTPIHFAASRGATEVIGLLLDSANNKRRKHIDLINDRDNERRTPLHRAAQGGYKQVFMGVFNSISTLFYQSVKEAVLSESRRIID